MYLLSTSTNTVLTSATKLTASERDGQFPTKCYGPFLCPVPLKYICKGFFSGNVLLIYFKGTPIHSTWARTGVKNLKNNCPERGSGPASASGPHGWSKRADIQSMRGTQDIRELRQHILPHRATCLSLPHGHSKRPGSSQVLEKMRKRTQSNHQIPNT